MTRAIPRTELSLPLVVTHLMKSVVYRDTHEQVWQHLVALIPRVSDFVATIGLVVVVDESEGYAYLRSKPEDPDSDAPPIPRLIARHALSFHASLMLALLRKKLAEFDASDDGSRLIVSRDQIIDMMVMFMSTSSNEARVVDTVDRTITKVTDLGFLRRLPKQDNQFEVQRVLKAFVDGQWLSDFEARLAEYAAELGEQR
ncbi:MAG: hypothetical protein QOG79_823 [Mycobacterium sp.]|jgi:hypothetical protein|nr:hypothetical protein [Actinoplanes sp.]MDT5124497.1 hypothetical protein [Mycobacterium sp.]MDT5292285.1 hypothetical protein [Mycobacterium sp.]MDT5297581.1 hypothetical protein [Mycobacterium sp.]